MNARIFGAICVLVAIATVAESRRWFAPELGCWITQSKMRASWEDAQQRCEKRGAVLASPLNPQLLDYMQSLIDVQNHSAAYFIGTRADRSDVDQEEFYVSVEGRKLADMPKAVYDAIDDVDLGQGDCLSMDRHGIRAVSCWDPLPYICYSKEMKECGLAPATTPTPTTVAPLPTPTMPPGYTYILATGSYYKFHERKVTWYEANATCTSEGAYLVVLNDAAEVNILPSIPGFRYGMWIGLRDGRPGGVADWRTVHRQPANTVFNRWFVGRPLNNVGYTCAFFFQENKLLYDEPCDYDQYFFTCERSQ